MTNPNIAPSDPKAALEKAKVQFREDMLTNDDFFGIVAKRLELNPRPGHSNLPDFSCEPVLTVRGDREFWAVRLGYSQTVANGPMTATAAEYDYVKIAEYSPAEQIYQPEPELLAGLKDLSIADARVSAEGIVRQWIAGMDMLHADPTLPVGISPMGGTVELLDELQQTAYIIDPTE